MNGKGIFMVRAVVANPDDRPGFDNWYETEHLPDALKAFNALRAWRIWSRSDPSVHIAFYEFPNAAAADAVQSTEGIKGRLRSSIVPGATRSQDRVKCGMWSGKLGVRATSESSRPL